MSDNFFFNLEGTVCYNKNKINYVYLDWNEDKTVFFLQFCYDHNEHDFKIRFEEKEEALDFLYKNFRR